jgi:hypothetical protein
VVFPGPVVFYAVTSGSDWARRVVFHRLMAVNLSQKSVHPFPLRRANLGWTEAKWSSRRVTGLSKRKRTSSGGELSHKLKRAWNVKSPLPRNGKTASSVLTGADRRRSEDGEAFRT